MELIKNQMLNKIQWELESTNDYSKAFGSGARAEESLICHVSLMPYIGVNPAEFWGRFASEFVGWFPHRWMWAPLPGVPSCCATTPADIKGLLLFSYVTPVPFLLFREGDVEKQTATSQQLTLRYRWVRGVQVLRGFRKIYCHCAVYLRQLLETGGKTNKNKQALQAMRSVCWRHK